MIFKKIANVLLFGLLPFFLVACGGGGGSSNSTSTSNSQFISGVVSNNRISSATLQVCPINNGVKDTNACQTFNNATGNDGSYSITLNNFSADAVWMEASGGTYVDEATGGDAIPLTTPLHAIGVLESNRTSHTLHITTVTHIAATLLGSNMSADAINAANNKVKEALFGANSTVDITQTKPVDIRNAATAGDQADYGLKLAILSQLRENRETDGITETLADMLQVIANDLADNDQLDTNQDALAIATQQFLVSPRNETGLTANDTGLDAVHQGETLPIAPTSFVNPTITLSYIVGHTALAKGASVATHQAGNHTLSKPRYLLDMTSSTTNPFIIDKISGTVTLANSITTPDSAYNATVIAGNAAGAQSYTLHLLVTATPSIKLAQDAAIEEGQENSRTIDILLTGDSFKADGVYSQSNIQVTNLPEGVGYSVLFVDNGRIRLILEGNRSVDYDSDITSLGLSVSREVLLNSIEDIKVVGDVLFSANNDTSIPDVTYSIGSLAGTCSNPVLSLTAQDDSPTVIFYTSDGTEPTQDATQYTLPILLAGDSPIRYYAVDNDFNQSASYTLNYSVYTYENLAGTTVVPGFFHSNLTGTDNIKLLNAPSFGRIIKNNVDILSAGDAFSLSDLQNGRIIYKSNLDNSTTEELLVFERQNAAIIDIYAVCMRNNVPSAVNLVADANFWVDAASRNSLLASGGQIAEENDPVTTWQDKSGNALHAVTTLVKAPGYNIDTSSALSNKPVVRFADSNETLLSAAGLPGGAEGYSIYAATRITGSHNNGLHGIVAANFARSGLFVQPTKKIADKGIVSRAFNVSDKRVQTRSYDESAWLTIAARNSVNTHKLHELAVSGQQTLYANKYPDILDNMSFRIGDTSSSIDTAVVGDIGEVLLFDRYLSEGENRKIKEYLDSKWRDTVISDFRQANTPLVIDMSDSQTRAIVYSSDLNDDIIGSSKGNTFVLGQGNGVITGGEGFDQYVFTADGEKRIKNFVIEQDTLNFYEYIPSQQGSIKSFFQLSHHDTDTLIKIDKQGQGDFDNPELTVSIENNLDVRWSDVGVDLTPDSDNLIAIDIRIDGSETLNTLYAGKEYPLSITAHYAGGETTDIPARMVNWSLSENAGAQILPAGQLGYSLHPASGNFTLSAEFNGMSDSKSLSSSLRECNVTMLEEIDVASRGYLVEQSIITTPLGYFTASNTGIANNNIPILSRLDGLLQLVQSSNFAPPVFARSHIGQLAYHDGFLYSGIMNADINTGNPLGETMIVKINPTTMALEQYWITNDYFSYLDAMDITNGTMWVTSPDHKGFLKIPMLEDGSPDFFSAENVVEPEIVGVHQGVQATADKLFTVPENTSNPEGLLGILVYELDKSIPPSMDYQLIPSYLYPFRFPADDPDHEAFGFSADGLNQVYLPYTPGENLVRLELGDCES